MRLRLFGLVLLSAVELDRELDTAAALAERAPFWDGYASALTDFAGAVPTVRPATPGAGSAASLTAVAAAAGVLSPGATVGGNPGARPREIVRGHLRLLRS